MQNMLAACTDIICWHNDIFGFQKVRSVQHTPHHMCLSDSHGQTGDFTLLTLRRKQCLIVKRNSVWTSSLLFSDGRRLIQERLNNDQKNTLVYHVFHEYNCQSYTQAGELVLELLHDRIAEMELAYERLRSAADPEFHPAIDLFMKTCRDWIPGSHEYHITSSRYNVSNTSFSDTGKSKEVEQIIKRQ